MIRRETHKESLESNKYYNPNFCVTSQEVFLTSLNLVRPFLSGHIYQINRDFLLESCF